MRLAVLLAASLACVGIGFAKSAALSAHVKDLETLQKIIQYLRGEIVTAASPLPDAFWETGRRMRDPYRDFLQDISEDMRRPDGKTLPAILEENTAVHLADTRLTKEEKEELIRHIYELAVHTRGERLTVEDQMIALSTCSSGNTNGRHLLICKVIKENTVEGSETE